MLRWVLTFGAGTGEQFVTGAQNSNVSLGAVRCCVQNAALERCQVHAHSRKFLQSQFFALSAVLLSPLQAHPSPQHTTCCTHSRATGSWNCLAGCSCAVALVVCFLSPIRFILSMQSHLVDLSRTNNAAGACMYLATRLSAESNVVDLLFSFPAPVFAARLLLPSPLYISQTDLGSVWELWLSAVGLQGWVNWFCWAT